MKNLIQIVGSEPKVSHRVIAKNTDNKILSIQNMISQNLSDFQEFGVLEFEIQKVKNSVGAINEQKTYWLNEQQATLLMTYLRNSEIVKTFKKNLVKAFFMIKEKLENPNIHELSGRVGGLTKANNDLRKELDKLKKKSKRRFENLEDDVDELKSKQFLITHKSFDEKLDLLFKRNKDILNRNTNEFNRETFIKWLQEHNVFYGEYLEILRTDATELQRWAINQFENEKKRRVEAEKELYKMKYRYEKTLNKISDLQKIAKNIVDFDMEIEKEMNMVDFG
ncbi:Rha family transcriptional regulator [Aliarcobacter cryaerophilus]|uniref:Rha family transcriptional regulator n=1 Tax=Aliarcobacter cryaerophilus TaxID=28198 RepID=UPI0021B58D21|nr:Rha family transcriptional regulator [Aliarcobacter cryaerophilus]MCT7510024.1 Rha family transcriptional regulator [Aliarcobacter cryaerophilus]